jgi:hypothetical protein
VNPAKETQAGDNGFIGTNLQADAAQLQPGLLAGAENLRFRVRQCEPRKGVIKPLWANQTNTAGKILPWGTVHGVGLYQDPSRVEWHLMAANGQIYRYRENNSPVGIPLPGGVVLTGRVKFVQAFNKVYLFRGQNFPVLRMLNFDNGFVDLVSLWNPAHNYLQDEEMAYGPWVNVTTLTSVGALATAVTGAKHGYVTGQDVTIINATQAEYNGRYCITVVDEFTFTYKFASSLTSPATTASTIKCSLMWNHYRCNVGGSVAGHTPDSNPAEWTQTYTVLPNSDDAIYVNNRLLAITAFTPSSTTEAFDSSSGYGKSDFLVATDVLDEIHVDFFNEFRINQGSSDVLLELQKFGETSLICLKSASWAVLGGVTGGDLSTTISLDVREKEYGVTCNGASVGGTNVYFMSEKRGVVSLRQTEQSKVESIDVPLSYDIQPLIDRINWTYKTRIRMAYWDNKLFVAVPLDDATQKHAQLIPSGAAFARFSLGSPLMRYTVTEWKPRAKYHFKPGTELYLQLQFTSEGYQILTTEQDFYAPDSGGRIDLFQAGNGTTPVTATITESFLSGVNNAILVYDFTTKQWTPYDTGRALMVREFYKAKCAGVERLYFVSDDGYINLVEESYAGDQVERGGDVVTGLGFDEIYQRMRSRGYVMPNNRMGVPWLVVPNIKTWNPSYSVTVLFDGVSESQPLDNDGVLAFTRDRTKYERPFDADDWEPTNANNDHATPYRQDYSVPIGDSGLNLGDGVSFHREQIATQVLGISPQAGRMLQIEIINTQGRLTVQSIEVDSRTREQREGVGI